MKRFSLLLLACFITTFALAEGGIGLTDNYVKKNRAGRFDRSRLLVGGGLGGGSLLNGGFFVTASPSVAYMFTDRFHAGFSMGVNYFRNAWDYNNYNTGVRETCIESGFHYSPSLFARYFVLDFLYLQIRPEYNSFKYFDLPSVDYNTGLLVGDPKRLNIPSFLVGAGYAQRLGNVSYMSITLMYDLVQNPNSPYYRRPVFGGGLSLGLFGN